MSLTNFRTLGRSGLVVSPLSLGTMTFGSGEWGADEAASREIFHAYRDAGGNFVDTADIYSGGASEELVGKFIQETASQDDIVLATKFGFNGVQQPADYYAGRRGQPQRRRSRVQEHPPRAQRFAEAARHRLYRPLLDAYLGWRHAD